MLDLLILDNITSSSPKVLLLMFLDNGPRQTRRGESYKHLNDIIAN